MKRLQSYLLPNENVHHFWTFGGLGDEMALTETRLLVTHKEGGIYCVLSVPYRSIAAIEVSESAMGGFLTGKFVRIRVAGEWVRFDLGKAGECMDIYHAIAGKMSP